MRYLIGHDYDIHIFPTATVADVNAHVAGKSSLLN